MSGKPIMPQFRVFLQDHFLATGKLCLVLGITPRAGLSQKQEAQIMSAAFMSPSQASWIAKRARKALRAGLLSHHQFTVLEVLLWEARPSGSNRVTAAYGWLQKLANVSRQTVADAIKAGIRLGLLRKIKHKVLVLWANGGRKWEQKPNEYVFDCESTRETEYPKQVVQIHKVEPNAPEIRAAQDALEARRRVLERKMLGKGRGDAIAT